MSVLLSSRMVFAGTALAAILLGGSIGAAVAAPVSKEFIVRQLTHKAPAKASKKRTRVLLRPGNGFAGAPSRR